MRGKVAKTLRRMARRATLGMLARSKLPRVFAGGTFSHGDQTTRATYQRLKSEFRTKGAH